MNEWVSAVETIGIPAVGAMGLGYLVWMLFKSLIADIHKKLDTQHSMIVALIDRIRQMDNDIILTVTGSLRWILAAAICSNMISAQASETPPLVVSPEQAGRCAETLSKAPITEADYGLALPFTVLNWNVEKAQHPDLVTEFAAYAERSDLIFLQEAVPLKKSETVIAQSLNDCLLYTSPSPRDRG